MILNPTNILFLGSGNYSIPIFQSLFDFCEQDDSFVLSGLITQPERLAGRGKKLTPCPLKQYTQDNLNLSIPCFEPEILADEADAILDQSKPDLIIVVDYGQMIPEQMLAFPNYKCLNIHHSLLPELRGATPIPAAILDGLQETGTSIVIMTKRLDAGAIVTQTELAIESTDTSASLGTKLSQLAAKLLIQTLPDWITGKIESKPQDEEQASYCDKSILAKDKSRIDWNSSDQDIDRHIRALNPNPIAWTTFRDKRLQIHYGKPRNDITDSPSTPGLIRNKNNQLLIATKKDWYEIVSLQPAGKNVMAATEFINGYQPQSNEKFI